MFGTITAFTIAHCITLSLSVLGHVRLAQGPIELLIALSILMLALELSHGRIDSLTFKRPWIVAFGFGLVHGFGFAGNLQDVGLPRADRAWALLSFNSGIEIGQLAFTASLVGATVLLSRLCSTRRVLLEQLAITPMGAVASFWCLDRTMAWLSM